MPLSSRSRPAWYGMVGRSDDAGKFTISENLLAQYVLIAYHPNYAPTLLRNVGWKEKGVKLALHPGHSLSGRVVPACAAQVQVRDRWGFARTVRTKSDGSFTFGGLDVGDCEVSATGPKGEKSDPLRASAGTTGLSVPLVSSPAK